LRWKQSYDAGVAPKVVLESTNIRALEYVTIEQLSNPLNLQQNLKAISFEKNPSSAQ
jgi:hypothetical protein